MAALPSIIRRFDASHQRGSVREGAGATSGRRVWHCLERQSDEQTDDDSGSAAGVDLGGLGFEVVLQALALNVDLKGPVRGGGAVVRDADLAKLLAEFFQGPAGAVTFHGGVRSGGRPLRDCSNGWESGTSWVTLQSRVPGFQQSLTR
jgi:hypothetical protein